MEGNFQLLGPIDLLQLLSRAQRTGVFRVPQGEVYLERGLPVHAVYQGRTGKRALLNILALQEGTFHFISEQTSPQRSLEGTLESYLLEAIRYLDQQVELTPFDQLEIEERASWASLTLGPEEFDLLQRLSSAPTPLDLARESRQPLGAILNRLGHLARIGLLRVTPRAPGVARLRLAVGLGSEVGLDPLLVQAWTRSFGSSARVELRAGEVHLKLSWSAWPEAGGTLLMSPEAILFHELSVGQEVMVWPDLA